MGIDKRLVSTETSKMLEWVPQEAQIDSGNTPTRPEEHLYGEIEVENMVDRLMTLKKVFFGENRPRELEMRKELKEGSKVTYEPYNKSLVLTTSHSKQPYKEI
ncbi:hypothetical protein HAX54_047127 [Datura stramonium]|uniref:Uncharacterized protein n=1 Tax=Datura stramonium TaxID=4076 RepID=A0ABS8SSR9_DATST|nr:hypothetical protein [Datura stramonium]